MRITRRVATIGILAAFLTACGGTTDGGTTGGTAGPTGPTGPTGPAATTPGLRGVVTAVAPLTVTGIRYDASSAAIRIDDDPGRPESEIKVGMIVNLKGSKDDAAGTGRATEIETHHALSGRVDDKGASGLHVGGHEVEVEHGTEFEDRIARLGSISVGERVRVHGHATATGAFRATRVEKEPGTSDDFEVKGFVSDLDAAGGKFTLKTTPDAASSYTVTLAAGVALPAGLSNGSCVEVHSAAHPVNGALTASAVELEDAKLGQAGSEAEVEGIVTSGGAAEFVVSGQAVATSATTRWENGVPADLAPGVKVEAEGRLDAANVLQASKVSFRANSRVQGPVSNVTATSAREGSFQVLGLTVRTDAFTEWRSSGSGGGGGGTLDLITIGAGPVEVRGMAGEAGEIIATRVEATNDDRLYLQGPVTSKDAAAGRLVVLGLTIQVGAGTSYRDVADAPLGAAAFFDQVVAPRTVVKARSRVPMAGSTFSADEVEIEGSR